MNPVVERGPRPVDLRLGGHAAELPVGYKLHRLCEIAPVEFGRKILRQRAREW